MQSVTESITNKGVQLQESFLDSSQEANYSKTDIAIKRKQLLVFSTSISILLIGITFLYFLTDPLQIKNDCAGCLYAGQRLLAGKLPYIDVVELNPPLIMYLNIIPAWLAKTFCAPCIPTFDACICALAAFSIGASVYVLSKSNLELDWEILGPGLIGSALLTFTAGAEFGQREQIMLLCYLPYFLLRWLRCEPVTGSSSRMTAFLLGVVAGIGLSLKPFYFLPAALPEFYWLLSKRWRLRLHQPEVLGVIVAVGVYAAHFLFLPTSVRDKFFGYVVPVVSGGYSAFNCPTWTLLSLEGYRSFALLMITVCVIAFLLRNSHSLIRPLLLFTIGGLMCFFIQHKGWGNHLFVPYFGVLLLGGVALGLVSKFSFFAINQSQWQTKPEATLAAYCAKLCNLCLILIIGLSTTVLFLSAKVALHKLRPRQITITERIIRNETNEHDAVAFFAAGVEGFPVLVQTGRPSGCRYLSGYPLTCLNYQIGECKSPEERTRLESKIQTFVSELEEDVVQRKPRLIFISKRQNFLGNMEKLGLVDFIAPSYGQLASTRDFTVFKRKSAQS